MQGIQVHLSAPWLFLLELFCQKPLPGRLIQFFALILFFPFPTGLYTPYRDSKMIQKLNLVIFFEQPELIFGFWMLSIFSIEIVEPYGSLVLALCEVFESNQSHHIFSIIQSSSFPPDRKPKLPFTIIVSLQMLSCNSFP